MVEWKKIEDVCKVLTGGDAPENCVKGQSKPSIENPYPVYSNGDEVYGFCSSYRVSENAVTISSIGNVGSVNFRLANFTPIIRLKVVIPCCPHLLTKFLFYNLLGYKFVGTSSSLSSMKAADIKRLSIPIPSLSEQNRIVSILDTFTSCIDNLKAQIAQRRKQFEFYRDQLLDLEGKDGVEMKTLGDIVSNDCSLSYGIVQPGEDVEGGVPVVRPVDLTSTYVYREGLKRTEANISEAYKRTILSGNEILFCVRGTTGIMGLATSDLKGCNVTRGIVPIKFDNEILKKFVYFQLKSFRLQKLIEEKTNGTALKQINIKDMRLLSIYLPSLSEQHRIVSILDTFEASISNLEAQLEQRQKQYEYYRNQLLTFD